MIIFKNVNKFFGKTHVLRNTNVVVKQGEKVCIVGPSGSGKSTLLRCINKLEEIQSGEIWVDGQMISGGTWSRTEKPRLRRKVGFVFQSYNLFPHLKIRENITLGLRYAKKLSKEKANNIAQDVLAMVNLQDKLSSYPSELSGGQQQRAAIARALAMDPLIMLFDEITSALDPQLIGEVLDVLLKLSESGKTMIIVTHEIGFARKISDRILFFDEGRVVEEGDPNEIIENPKTNRARAFFAEVMK